MSDVAERIRIGLMEDPRTRRWKVEVSQNEESILLDGQVFSFYSKQIAQTVAMNEMAKCNGYAQDLKIQNNLLVIG